MFKHREKDKALIDIINWWLEDPTKRKIDNFPEELRKKITDEELKFHIKRARRFTGESFESAFIRYKEDLESKIREEERHDMERTTQWLIVGIMFLTALINGWVAAPRVFHTVYACPDMLFGETVRITLTNSGDAPAPITYEIQKNNILSKADVNGISFGSYDNSSFVKDGYENRDVKHSTNILPKLAITEDHALVINMREVNDAWFVVKYSYDGWLFNVIPFITMKTNYEIANCKYTRDDFGTFRLK